MLWMDKLLHKHHSVSGSLVDVHNSLDGHSIQAQGTLTCCITCPPIINYYKLIDWPLQFSQEVLQSHEASGSNTLGYTPR